MPAKAGIQFIRCSMLSVERSTLNIQLRTLNEKIKPHLRRSGGVKNSFRSSGTQTISDLIRAPGKGMVIVLCKPVFDHYFIEIQLPRSRPWFFYALANCYKHCNDMFCWKTDQFGNFFKIKSIHRAGIIAH